MLVYEMRFNIQAHRLHTFFTWRNRACIGVKANLYEATVQRVFEILLRISKGVLMRNLGLNPYPGLRLAMCVSSWISRTPLPSPSEEFLACSFFTSHQKNRSSRSRRVPFWSVFLVLILVTACIGRIRDSLRCSWQPILVRGIAECQEVSFPHPSSCFRENQTTLHLFNRFLMNGKGQSVILSLVLPATVVDYGIL
ncbi:hypothetical protein VNO77_15855 [Canavalia gladiata]|uniref:Uncharacterized protein n=1 Tax=Canavalia gladiata TaxID=3824 RepID=A0AAN9QRK4_CANGL